MSVNDEITRLSKAKSDIASAISSKGVSVPSDSSISDYAALVSSISNDGSFIDESQKGVANGVATLDENAKIPATQIPDEIARTLYVTATADSNRNVTADKTYSEINAAINNETIVTVIYENVRFSLYGKTDLGIIFVRNVYGTSYTALILSNENIWSVVEKSLSSGGVTIDKSISSSSTDNNVPSSKCVYDSIESVKGMIPSVPSWAMQSNKPSYSASEVGADASGTATSEVSTHNTNTSAHNDLRLELKGLSDRLNALADSDDTTLDQMSEIVKYIKNNKSLIDNITTTKVNVADIIDNLTTNVSNKPLSAAQGVALKSLIDAITVPTSLSQLSEDTNHRLVTDSEKTTWNSKLDLSATNNAIKSFFGGKTVVFSDTPPANNDQNVITFVKRG